MGVSLSFCLFLLLIQFVSCFGCLEQERKALLEIKAFIMDNVSPHNEFISTWVGDEGSNCCDWERVRCNTTTHRVTLINLEDSMNDVDGIYLNASLFLPFEELQHLDLSYINFVGWRYNEGLERLSTLSNLQELNLQYNSFNSSILLSVSELISLTGLNLARLPYASSEQQNPNGIERLSNLKKLEYIYLSGCQFGNDILPVLGALPNLKTLDLSYNLLNGSLSSFPKGWSKLRILDLSHNYFSGKISASILSLRNLKALSLSENNITDSLSGICELVNLWELDLSYNHFEGIIPPCLSNLTNLRLLTLSNNNLTENIPPFLTSNWKYLRVLDLSSNKLTGRIPPRLLFNLTQLRYISFSNNLLDGNAMITSTLENTKVQFSILGMNHCNLYLSTDDLLRILRNQFNLTTIDLSYNKLHGKFPNWLAKNNTRLEMLLLQSNSLTGHIHFPGHPIHVKLRQIVVSNNDIQGELQKNFGEILPNVRTLNLSSNSIGGCIPPSLGYIRDLSEVDLSSNKFSGTIPRSLGFTGRLYLLKLSNNRLDGRIPSDLISAGDLILSNNKFTGFTRWNINRTQFYPFHKLDISQNDISGRIPTWIGDLTEVLSLNLQDNNFDGPIPKEICQLSRIVFLDLSKNKLSGAIPTCLNLTNLEYMHMQGNKLTGEVPRTIANSKQLLGLDLGDNMLSGVLPDWLNALQSLRFLVLGRNFLCGNLSHKLCEMNNLGILDLSHNHFSGSIPLCFSNITFGESKSDVGQGISEYTSSGRIMDDTLSVFLRNTDYTVSENTGYRDVGEVNFTTKSRSSSYGGNILNFMSGIDLSCNSLTGEIPQEIGALTELHALNLSNNQLTGPIPKKLSEMKNMESMDFSHNRLSGEIPSEFSALNYLAVFSVSYNNLSGRIPDMKAQFSTFGETSYVGNPFLCGLPLQNLCNNTTKEGSIITRTAEKVGIDPISFMASTAATYVMTLLALVIVLYINRYWRGIWFEFVDRCLVFMFPSWSKTIYKGYGRRR